MTEYILPIVGFLLFLLPHFETGFSPWRGLNPRPADYKSAALPLSYKGDKTGHFV